MNIGYNAESRAMADRADHALEAWLGFSVTAPIVAVGAVEGTAAVSAYAIANASTATTVTTLTTTGGVAANQLVQELPAITQEEQTVVQQAPTILYRAVSEAERLDIMQNGFRVINGGYETGKLFTPTIQEAAQFGLNNYFFDQLPFTIMQVNLPGNITTFEFEADGMNAVSIPASQLNLLTGTPLNSIPWIH